MVKNFKAFNESNQSDDDILLICEKYNIINYTINDDNSIDVSDNVNISYKNLTKLPLKFRNVSGHFMCNNNELISLEGAPRSVVYGFYCNDNKLISLEGAPESVCGSFFCYGNQLTSLKGAPQSVSGDFACGNNKLINLKGAPRSVGSFFVVKIN